MSIANSLEADKLIKITSCIAKHLKQQKVQETIRQVLEMLLYTEGKILVKKKN